MEATDKLGGLLDFVTFTHEIRKIKRAMWVKGEEQFENDSEHGYQLALVALYIIEENHLELDAYRSMGIALVHDILEVYSGDTPAFAGEDIQSTKANREHKAILRLQEQWPQMGLMLSLIDEYEARASKESKFIYALDKLVPMLNNYLDNGRNWHREGIGLRQVMAVKQGKVDIDPDVASYYADIIELLKNRSDLFSKKSFAATAHTATI